MRQDFWEAALAALAVGAAACEPVAPPPGRLTETAPDGPSLPLPTAAPASSAAATDRDADPSGGLEIASIAMRTWVYAEPDERANKLGYLRAGAVVARGAEPAGTAGCAGGWYRVAPRGYVCVGKGAALELDHPVVQAARSEPRRGEPLPYRYVISRSPPPHLYCRLPSQEEQASAEGERRERSIAAFTTLRSAFEPPDPIPAFLQRGDTLPKPYGADTGLAYRAHRGRARPESAFGLGAVYEWTGRLLGLTTELDLIPVDRTRPAPASKLRGVSVAGEGVPAFVAQHGVSTYRQGERGRFEPAGEAPYRSGWVLTGRNNGSERGLLETAQGAWLPYATLRIAKKREDPAGFARDGQKWIDVSVRQQMLVAYEGARPVFAALVSTGRGELGDPEKTHATVRGTFMIHAKHVTATMDGDQAGDDAFDLRDVPYVQYFYEGFALHGAYWHDELGKVRSHGCINLAPADAAWLFEWTEPVVPRGWHGAQNPNYGTLVYVHR
ncbi:MAG: L,D-transpeptidase [Deltaproteobacteria bacterium]|nr:L,D-transpeptidase [Deltaproteobacteria bacterium]